MAETKDQNFKIQSVGLIQIREPELLKRNKKASVIKVQIAPPRRHLLSGESVTLSRQDYKSD